MSLKRQIKIATDNILISFTSNFGKQRIHMKYQVLFSLKNNVKVHVFMNVVCCSRDRCFKG